MEKTIEVTVNEEKFDGDFLKDFKRFFYPLETVEEHVKHLAQLKARGFIPDWEKDGIFIEGYGQADEMGIKLIETSEYWTCEIDE